MTAILFVLSNLTFPPQEGVHEQAIFLIKALRSHGYEVSVLALVRKISTFDAEGFDQWIGGCKIIKVFPNRLNFFLLTIRLLFPYGSPLYLAFNKMLRELPKAIIHLEGIGLSSLLAHTQGHSTLISTIDAWSLRQSRLAKDAVGAKYLFLRFYALLSTFIERRFFPQASAVHVVSAADAQWLRQSIPTAQIKVIPVALLNLPMPRIAYINRLDSPLVVFWGDIGVPYLRSGLEWLLAKVIPLLECKGIYTELIILGRREPDDILRALAGKARFLGWVENVDEILRQADVVVLPDQNGTGLKNRALRAMACGVPVVGTSQAFEGFSVIDGVEAMIRDTPENFTEALLEILASHEKANAIATSGRAFAVNGYGVDTVIFQWEQLYKSIENIS
jgi:glycosyltransferase involved in cell wall biosynthesis